MQADDLTRMYQKLYRMFDGTTPLNGKDCGLVCGKACCSGDERVGMLLFPFEPTTLKTVEKDGRRYVLCGGACCRSERPLACRIFPFFPVVDENGKIEVQSDSRGYGVCPLVRNAADVRFSKTFLRRVKRAGKMLRQNEACAAFLAEVSAEIAEIRSLTARMENG